MAIPRPKEMADGTARRKVRQTMRPESAPKKAIRYFGSSDNVQSDLPRDHLEGKNNRPGELSPEENSQIKTRVPHSFEKTIPSSREMTARTTI